METSVPLCNSCSGVPRAKISKGNYSFTRAKSRQRNQLTRSKRNGAGEETSKNSHTNGSKQDEQWEDLAFPTYLQSEVDDFCQDWDEALQLEERRQSDASHRDVTKKSRGAVTRDNPVWQAIRKEAAKDAAQEPILSSFLYASVLSHDSFEMALAAILANRLSDPTMMATELIDIFHSVLRGCQEVEQAALADVIAVRERDPACTAYSSALLYYKGYHALQTHRIAHGLWERGQTVLARSLQYRCTQTLAVDIHPAARIGKGVLLDHGTGLVIGETAVVGNNVSILHNVTLGGTGKEIGDRHPKVNDNVLIGANATILGNISIGKGAQVAAGSLVLKNVPPRTMVAGSPAKEVGKVTGNPALKMQHWMKNQLVKESYAEKWEDIVRSGAARSVNHVSEASNQSPSKEGVKAIDPTDPDALSRLPAEFGTKDKVPAKGTAPMGPQDYADGAQWTARDGTMQRRESEQPGGNNGGIKDAARDSGYIGGDGAKLNGAMSQQDSSSATDTASSETSATASDQSSQQDRDSGAREQPQGRGQVPDQAGAETSKMGEGLALPGSRKTQQLRSTSASSDGAKEDGARLDSGRQVSASSDSDWWREVTAASKRNDCSSTASALSSKKGQQDGAGQHRNDGAGNRQHGAEPSKQIMQDGASRPSSSNTSSQASPASSTSNNGAASSSSSQRASSGQNASSSSSSSSTSPTHGLSRQDQSTSRASSSSHAPHNTEEESDRKRRIQEVKEVASKIENQMPGQKEALSSRPGKTSQPPADIEYWI